MTQGEKEKETVISWPKKINSTKPVSFQQALLGVCNIKDFTGKEKRDPNWELEDLGSCLAFAVQLLSDYGQIFEPRF